MHYWLLFTGVITKHAIKTKNLDKGTGNGTSTCFLTPFALKQVFCMKKIGVGRLMRSQVWIIAWVRRSACQWILEQLASRTFRNHTKFKWNLGYCAVGPMRKLHEAFNLPWLVLYRTVHTFYSFQRTKTKARQNKVQETWTPRVLMYWVCIESKFWTHKNETRAANTADVQSGSKNILRWFFCFAILNDLTKTKRDEREKVSDISFTLLFLFPSNVLSI